MTGYFASHEMTIYRIQNFARVNIGNSKTRVLYFQGALDMNVNFYPGYIEQEDLHT